MTSIVFLKKVLVSMFSILIGNQKLKKREIIGFD
jgi:hypothetical protein